jgi:hypothetical protein
VLSQASRWLFRRSPFDFRRYDGSDGYLGARKDQHVTTVPASPVLVARRLLMIAAQVDEFTSDKMSAETLRSVAKQLNERGTDSVEVRDGGTYPVKRPMREATWKHVKMEAGWDLADVLVAIQRHGKIAEDNATRDWADDSCRLLRAMLARFDPSDGMVRCVDATIYGIPAPRCAACGDCDLKDGWAVRPVSALDRGLTGQWGQPNVISAPADESVRAYSFGYHVHASCLEDARRNLFRKRWRTRLTGVFTKVVLLGVLALLFLVSIFVVDHFGRIIGRALVYGFTLYLLLAVGAIIICGIAYWGWTIRNGIVWLVSPNARRRMARAAQRVEQDSAILDDREANQ